jgi:hypothetical protein
MIDDSSIGLTQWEKEAGNCEDGFCGLPERKAEPLPSREPRQKSKEVINIKDVPASPLLPPDE